MGFREGARTSTISLFGSDKNDFCLNSDAPDGNSAVLGCIAAGDFEDYDHYQTPSTWSQPIDPGFGGVKRNDDGSCSTQTFADKVLLGFPNEKQTTRGYHVGGIKAAQGIGGYIFDCINRESDSASYDSMGAFYESAAGCLDGETMTDCNGYIDEQIDECTGSKGTKYEFYGYYFDGTWDTTCKARANTDKVRAQAVCCTWL